MTRIIRANDNNFDDFINNGATVSIVVFLCPDSELCILLKPLLIEMLYRFSIQIVKINVNECPRITSKFKVKSLPSIFFFKNKYLKSKLSGFIDKSSIVRCIEKLIN